MLKQLCCLFTSQKKKDHYLKWLHFINGHNHLAKSSYIESYYRLKYRFTKLDLIELLQKKKQKQTTVVPVELLSAIYRRPVLCFVASTSEFYCCWKRACIHFLLLIRTSTKIHTQASLWGPNLSVSLSHQFLFSLLCFPVSAPSFPSMDLSVFRGSLILGFKKWVTYSVICVCLCLCALHHLKFHISPYFPS